MMTKQLITLLLVLVLFSPRALPAAEPAPLSIEQKERLRQHGELFATLKPEEQTRVRALHETLAAETPASKDLRGTMEKFERWLATLSQEERQQIIAATTNEERLSRVRALVEKQSALIERDLEPLEAFAPPREPAGNDPPRPNAVFRQRLAAMEDQRQLLAKIEPLWTPAERAHLKTLKRFHRSLYILALATKYDLPIPPNVREIQPPVFQIFMNLVENPASVFGDKLPRQLSEEARQLLGAFMVDILLLPNVEGEKRFAFLQSQPLLMREAVEQVTENNAIAGQILLNACYFVLHPDEAPLEARDSLALVHSESALAAFGRTMLRERLPTRPRIGPPQPRPPRPND